MTGENGFVNASNQFYEPHGLDIDDGNQRMVIADLGNDRTVEWKAEEKNGKVIAVGRSRGNRLDQLNYPVDVLIGKETGNLLIEE